MPQVHASLSGIMMQYIINMSQRLAFSSSVRPKFVGAGRRAVQPGPLRLAVRVGGRRDAPRGRFCLLVKAMWRNRSRVVVPRPPILTAPYSLSRRSVDRYEPPLLMAITAQLTYGTGLGGLKCSGCSVGACGLHTLAPRSHRAYRSPHGPHWIGRTQMQSPQRG